MAGKMVVCGGIERYVRRTTGKCEGCGRKLPRGLNSFECDECFDKALEEEAA